MNSLERRVAALEGRTRGPGIVCLFMRRGDDEGEVLRRWEAENGPIGERTPIMVNFVDAAL